MTLLAQLDARLQELHARTAETPLFNPVFQLGLELSRQIESGALKLGEVAALVAELECEGLQARANRLEELRRERGLCSDSEVVRRLIDDAPRKGAPVVGPIGEVRLPRRGLDLAELQEGIERALVEQAVDKAKGNLSRAAALLRISRWTLLRKLRRYGLCGSATADVRGRTAG